MTLPVVESVTETSFASDTTSHAVNMPATVNAGDLLLVLLAVDGNQTITTPTGWTTLANVLAGSSVCRLLAFAKVAVGDEDGTTVDFVTAVAADAAAQCYRITSWYGKLTGITPNNSGAGGSSTSPNPAVVIPLWSTFDTLFVAANAHRPSATTSAYPANYTNGVETVGADARVSSARLIIKASADDAGAFTITASEGWAAFTIAVRGSGYTVPKLGNRRSIIYFDSTDDVYDNNRPNAASGRKSVVTPSGERYFFFTNVSTQLKWIKSIDRGQGWFGPDQRVISTDTILDFCVWADWWTPGDNGTKIHIWFNDSVVDDILYCYIDTATDFQSTNVLVFSGASTATFHWITGWKTRGGNLHTVFDLDGGTEIGHYRSTDGGSNWGSRAAVAEAAGADWFYGFPGMYADNNDSEIYFFDTSANEISRKVYDDSADSVAETSIQTSMVEVDISNAPLQWAAAINPSNGHTFLIAWSERNSATADLMCWESDGNGTVTARTNVVTNAINCGNAALAFGANGILWAFYCGAEDGSERLPDQVGVYCKFSKDNGQTWSNEIVIFNAIPQVIHFMECSIYLPVNYDKPPVMWSSILLTAGFNNQICAVWEADWPDLRTPGRSHVGIT